MSYFVDQQVEVIGNIKDINGVLTDATVAAELRDPDGNRTPMTVFHDSTGVYHFFFTPLKGGTYWYQWEATGAITAAYEGSIDVAPTMFPD